MVNVSLSDRKPISDFTTAVDVLLETQNELQVDLRVLIRLLQTFLGLEHAQVLYPRASDYSSLSVLQQQITLAIDSMGAKTLGGAVTSSGSRLHHPPADLSLLPSAELVDAGRRVELLRPIDDIVHYYYEALQKGTLTLAHPALGDIVNFAYCMVSHHGPDQLQDVRVSGQSAPVFFPGLRRRASRELLAFVYLSTRYKAIPDAISPSEVLQWAESATDPFFGAEEQGSFMRRLFPSKDFDPAQYRRLPALTAHALRSPYDVWPDLRGCCLGCGMAHARYTCSLCGLMKYCSAGCQRSLQVYKAVAATRFRPFEGSAARRKRYKRDDLQFIINVIDQIEVAEGSIVATTLPPIDVFPSREALIQTTWLAIFGLSLFASHTDIGAPVPQLFSRAMRSINQVYSLNDMRFEALGRKVWMEYILGVKKSDSTSDGPRYPLEDLRCGWNIAEELAPVDLVVSRMYQTWMKPGTHPGIGHGMHPDWVLNVSSVCLNITSNFHRQLEKSGQSSQDFFSQLHRKASHMYLAFIIAGLDHEAISYNLTKRDVLLMAERATPPCAGARVQGLFIVSLFGHAEVTRLTYRMKSQDVRTAMRPPTEIWPELRDHCVWCLGKATKVCAKCRRIRYCSRLCQRERKGTGGTLTSPRLTAASSASRFRAIPASSRRKDTVVPCDAGAAGGVHV
ncbi:hypothetical protein PENSPDRAFT_670934 [Peniophora sp. CONT]|nr:hypothetical protein PENSPDRAFT_670934 [Peniophora sp. CONT]